MPFRDDRDALLARADALDREARRLRDELEAKKAKLAAREGAADERARVEAELARLARDNERLQTELRRARGPGLLSRVRRRLAGLRREPPPAPEGYLGGALRTWRLYVACLPVFAVSAWYDPAPWRLWILAGYALGTPLCAAVFLAIPWLLGRRRAVTAAGTAGLAIGLSAVGLVITAVIVSMVTSGFAGPGMWLMPLMVYVAVLLMHLFGAVRWGDIDLFVLPWLMFFGMPGPHYVMGLMFPFFFYIFGARLVDPTFAR